MAMNIYGESFIDSDSGTIYTPYINEQGQVGYKCERQITDDDDNVWEETTYFYLNASGGSDDGVATIFVYQDENGKDLMQTLHYYEVWDDNLN